MTNDYADFVDETEGVEALARLNTLAQDLYDAEREVAQAEKALKAAQQKRDQLATQTIPDAMDAAGVKTFETPGGIKMTHERKIRGGVIADVKDAAFEWLVKNGHGGIVKNELVVNLGKDSDALAAELEGDDRFDGKDVKTKRSVHHANMDSWMQAMLSAGTVPPADLFRHYEQRTVKIKKTKED